MSEIRIGHPENNLPEGSRFQEEFNVQAEEIVREVFPDTSRRRILLKSGESPKDAFERRVFERELGQTFTKWRMNEDKKER